MGTTQPIRDKREVLRFISYYQVTKPSARNNALILFGLHTALRISDILSFKWGDVYDFEANCYRSHIHMQEKKTGKSTHVVLNMQVTHALNLLKEQRPDVTASDYIFTKNTDYSCPLNRSQAYRIIKRAALEVLQDDNVSCHSLRKTFGYHAWKRGTQPALLMDIYNHSSYYVTKKYLGIAQDERDMVFRDTSY
jgi:integrase